MKRTIPHKKGLLALSPLAVFLIVYLVSSIIAGDFYKIPVSSAFLAASIFAIATTRGSMTERINVFSRGAGHPNVMLMLWIFILAGAFAGTAKDIGAVDATVNLILSVIPVKMLYAGLFLAACFISMSVGTSVGTVVALAPLAMGIAQQSGLSVAHMVGIVVGGAFFGDNLSFISDTTIAATRALGVEMRDKFRVNILITLPAVLVVTCIYLFQGMSLDASAIQHASGSLVKVIPYLLIIVLAIAGTDVTLALTVGILVNAVIGFCCGDFTWTAWLESMGGGIAGMYDLIVVTLLAGGLLEVMRHNGGLDYIIEGLTSRISGKRGAQGSIAALVALSTVCTANNTIAIITTGGIAGDITKRFGLDPRKTASILDMFSCLVQGLLPYGAQLLMVSGLTGLAATAIIPHLYYSFCMGICAILAIIFRYPRKYSL